jgi:hypothetical protein
MDTWRLCCLQYGPIKYVAYGMDRSSLNCLQYGHMEFKLYTVWKSFYMINPVSLRCWQYGPIQPFLQPYTHKPDTTWQVLLLQLSEQFCAQFCPYIPSTQATNKSFIKHQIQISWMVTSTKENANTVLWSQISLRTPPLIEM